MAKAVSSEDEVLEEQRNNGIGHKLLCKAVVSIALLALFMCLGILASRICMYIVYVHWITQLLIFRFTCLHN